MAKATLTIRNGIIQENGLPVFIAVLISAGIIALAVIAAAIIGAVLLLANTTVP